MNMQKILPTTSVLALLFFAVFAFNPSPANAYGSGREFDFGLFQQFLDAYAKKDSRIGEFHLTTIDYRKIHSDKARVDSLYGKVLKNFAYTDLAKLPGREEKIAFWINAYNFGAIKLIIDHYPVESIRDRKINFLKNPWNIKILTIGGTEYALGQIEHVILLGELAEPMAHFGVVCASVSCPNLNIEAYTPERVEEQLAEMAKAFLTDRKKGLLIDRSKDIVYFSKIFKFDKKTFPEGAESAIRIFSRYFDPDDLKYLLKGRYKIRYFDYNWELNQTPGSK